ncbi:MAG: ribokinase [Candidatus Dormibacter sp.]
MKAPIVVLGSLNTDFVMTMEHLPKPGETVPGERLTAYAGGKGANQAVAAARLGGQVAMVGRVGNDAPGRELLASLMAAGVDQSGVGVDPAAASGAALILVGPDGQNMIAVAPGANGNVGQEEVARTIERLQPVGILVLQLEVPAAAVLAAARGARAAGVRVLLNAAPAPASADGLVAAADVLIVNESEAGQLWGHPVRDPAAAAAAAQWAVARGAGAAVVTLGAAGAVLCANGQVVTYAARQVEAVDTTAAGDAFVGALAARLAAGSSLEEAADLAGAAGAATVTKRGAQSSLPSPEDLWRLFGIRI